MYHHLREKGKGCRIINCSQLPEEYDFLNHDNIIEMYVAEEHDEWLRNCNHFVDLLPIYHKYIFIECRI